MTANISKQTGCDDRKLRNRINQRRRRQGLLRIDYIPLGEAREIIEAERSKQANEWCVSSFLDMVVTQWEKVNNR